MISVLTVVKNRPRHLEHLVEGLRRSSVPPEELIVVDMSDEPVSLGACAFPGRVLRHPVGGGLPLAEARNRAAAAARSDRLLFLDVDCIPAAGLVGAMAAALAAHDALLCPEVLYLGPGAVGDDWDESALRRQAAAHPARPFPETGVRQVDNVGLFWSIAFGITRATFDALGGFDPAFTGYGAEDTDLGFSARRQGVALLFVGGPGAFHQHHGVVDPPLQHFADIVRNARVFHDKWGVWPMEGWLAAFQRHGLVLWSEDRLAVVREPTPAEIAAASRRPEARF